MVTPSVSPAENNAVIVEKNACGSYADMAITITGAVIIIKAGVGKGKGYAMC